MKKDKEKLINNRLHRLLKYIMAFIIPVVIFVGGMLLINNKSLWVSVWICILSGIPFYLSFEKRNSQINSIMILSVMVVFAVIGRYIFAFVPHFKPVTAVVIIASIYLGPAAGFLCGSLSALLSNIIFGQGIWTLFQMFSWGIIGLLAGLFSKLFTSDKYGRFFLYLYGIIAGIIFTLVMDISSVFFIDGEFNLSRYLTFLVAALPITVVYAVSNVIFLILLAKPIGKKLERIKVKYGI